MKKVLLIGILSAFCMSAFASSLMNTVLTPGETTHYPIRFDNNGELTGTCTVTPTGKNTSGTLAIKSTASYFDTFTSNPTVTCVDHKYSDEDTSTCTFNNPGKVTMKLFAQGDDKDPGYNSAVGFILSPDSSTSYKIVCDGEKRGG